MKEANASGWFFNCVVIFGLVEIFLFVAMILIPCSLFCMSGRYLDYAETLLSNSTLAIANRVALDSGVRSRMTRLYSIALLLAFPRFFIWRGLLDSNDFEHFPAPARLWLAFNFYFSVFVIGAMMACDPRGASGL